MAATQSLLNHQQLAKLKEHKYSSVNYAFLDPYMNHFWTWLVQKVPVYIHPNSMTVAGLVANALTTLLLIYYSPDAKTPAPFWVYLACALGIFVYQTLDAMDGKHARRTNTSSPLGELFDHGCDALSTVLVTIGVCITLNLGNNIIYLCLYAFSAEAVYYLAHWQTYVTGTLQFGTFDVTELQFVCITCHLITATLGVQFWDEPLPYLGFVPQTFTVLFMVIGVGVSVFCKSAVILQGGPGRNGSAVGNMSILSPVFPLAFVMYSGYYVYTRSEFVYLYPVLFCVGYGIIMCKITDRLVVAHMTQSEMKLLDSAYIVPLIIMGRLYWNFLSWIPDYMLLWALLIHASIDLLYYSSKVTIEIRDALNITVFSMAAPTAARSTSWNNNSPNRRGIPQRINVGGRVAPHSPRSRAPINTPR